jgi:hypothetical protein
MHTAYLNLVPKPESKDPESYIDSSLMPFKLLQDIKTTYSINISVVQRATFNISETLNDISYHFIMDEFESALRWWQEPESIFQLLADMEPDIIHVSGLNLPLQFRWLRRIVGDKIKIIGEHTGETFWAQRNLWIQQFGLRVVDGFIFKKIKDAHAWTKASVILEKQPIAEIDLFAMNPQETAKLMVKFYNKLLTTKDREGIETSKK